MRDSAGRQERGKVKNPTRKTDVWGTQIPIRYLSSGPPARRIVVQYNLSGVQVHDARLAAAMYVHSVGNILTLNIADFSRFAGLSAIHPSSI